MTEFSYDFNAPKYFDFALEDSIKAQRMKAAAAAMPAEEPDPFDNWDAPMYSDFSDGPSYGSPAQAEASLPAPELEASPAKATILESSANAQTPVSAKPAKVQTPSSIPTRVRSSPTASAKVEPSPVKSIKPATPTRSNTSGIPSRVRTTPVRPAQAQAVPAATRSPTSAAKLQSQPTAATRLNSSPPQGARPVTTRSPTSAAKLQSQPMAATRLNSSPPQGARPATTRSPTSAAKQLQSQPTAATRLNSSPTQGARPVTNKAQASPGTRIQPSPAAKNMVPAKIQAKAPASEAAGAASLPPPPPPQPKTARVAPPAPPKNLQSKPFASKVTRPTSSSSSRTATNPAKTTHSFMHHTSASKRHTAVDAGVHKMSSFLRPTASSFSRKQQEKEQAEKQRAKAVNLRSTVNKQRAVPSSLPAKKLESTEERDLRLAAEAKARLKEQVTRNRQACERNRYVGGMAGTVRSSKALTIPKSPRMHGLPPKQVMPEPEPPKPTKKVPAYKPTYSAPAPAPAMSRAVNKGPPPQQQNWANRKLTVPHQPAFHTDKRGELRKTEIVPGSKELEDEIECQKLFKARPLDERILHSTGDLGVPKVASKDVTTPHPFHFKTDERIGKKPHEEEPVKQKKPVKYTGHQGLVVPEPFDLATERRGEMHKMHFERKVAEEREVEEQQTHIKALPVPNFEKHDFCPIRSNKELTEFHEFHLASVARHQEAQAAFQEHVQHEMEEERSKTLVKALPLPVTTYEKRFEVKSSDREPLVPMSMNLTTQIRAEQRKMYEESQHERLLRQQQEQQAAIDAIKRAEADELMRLRTTSVEEGGLQFFAKPIKGTHHPMKPAPSMKKLTTPLSPRLHTTTRVYSRRQAQGK